MNTNKTLLLLLLLALISCKSNPTNPGSAPIPITVEGTVYYFGGGGTVELQYPAGFRLTDCKWINSPGDSNAQPYISGIVDSSYIDKQIRVVGLLDTVTFYQQLETSKFKGSYIEIKIDSLQILK